MTKVALLRTFRPYMLFVFLFWAKTPEAGARHILAAQMYYNSLGNNTYEFVMEIYRDCACTSCADFDPVAHIGIYQCTSIGHCPGQSQSAPFASVDVPLSSRVSLVPHPASSCVSQTSGCFEKGEYRFTRQLPPSNNSYVVVYQRCCYVPTISNIINAYETGISVFTELTPAAQQLNGNSSPRFPENLVLELCTGQAFAANFSFVDPDNHILVYEFCSPVKGGANNLGSSTFMTCQGAYPKPGCPPPYSAVIFAAPSYSALHPFVTNQSLALNPATGSMTGLPTVSGHFLAAVCASEYNEFNYLGTHIAQFTVLVSPPTSTRNPNENVNLFSVFPNPASRSFFVQPADPAKPFQLLAYDHTGKRYPLSHSNAEFPVEITGLAPGLYVIRMEQNGVTAYKKVLLTGY